VFIFLGIGMMQLNCRTQKMNQISGQWQFEKVNVNQEFVSASTLNECNYSDILEFRKETTSRQFEVGGEIVKAYEIGSSDKFICLANYENYQFELKNNSCPTRWIQPVRQKNRLIKISEGAIIEYEFKRHNPEAIYLEKLRVIISDGLAHPDYIQLKRMPSKP